MGVYGLPGTVKIWHFELTQDHLDTDVTEGMRRSLRLFCSQPLQYGCLWTPLDTSSQDLAFLADSRPPGHWWHRGHFFFVPNPNNMGVYRLPWTQAIKIWHFELTQDHLETEDSKGMRRLLCFSSSKPLQHGCLQTPLVTSNQDLAFWAISGQPGHWGL